MKGHNNFIPNTFNKFIGQNKLVNVLKVIIKSASKRAVAIDHILFYGEPGSGKTTLAKIISNVADYKIKTVQGPMLEKKSDVLSLLGSIEKNCILFIDEIHGINKNIEELLYSAMEENAIDIFVGIETESKIIRVTLPKFTLIGATTKLSKISKPLRDRFGLTAKLLPYNDLEISKIIKNNAKNINLNLNNDNCIFIAGFCNNNPRKANNILKRINDYHIVHELKIMDNKVIKNILNKLGIYKFGLEDQHLIYLNLLKNSNENWLAIETISGMLSEDKVSLENIVEPQLIKLDLIKKSSRGRKMTIKGQEYLNKNSNKFKK